MAVYFDPDGTVVDPRTAYVTHGLAGQGQGLNYNAPAFRPQQQQQVILVRTSPRNQRPQVQPQQQFMTGPMAPLDQLVQQGIPGAGAFAMQQEPRPTGTNVLDMLNKAARRPVQHPGHGGGGGGYDGQRRGGGDRGGSVPPLRRVGQQQWEPRGSPQRQQRGPPPQRQHLPYGGYGDPEPSSPGRQKPSMRLQGGGKRKPHMRHG